MNRAAGFVAGMLVVFGLTFSPNSSIAQQTVTQLPDPLDSLPVKQREMVVAFRERVKDYTKLREAIEAKMPPLAKETTPEQIQAHKTEFEARVRSARAEAKRGQLFTPDIAAFIRATIKKEFRGAKLKELRASVFEADTKRVPLRVNYTYPESAEMVEMPPTLLLRLPQLPKQVRYRFVGRNMLLVDRENGLIVDYMLNALP
ncbi:MAG TPA: hypothetical protein VEX70_02055 [Pyrinomonadaceae bacterium]|nr:hypothetical protein [Pyrinomonadaceae bacterium]